MSLHSSFINPKLQPHPSDPEILHLVIPPSRRGEEGVSVKGEGILSQKVSGELIRFVFCEECDCEVYSFLCRPSRPSDAL